MGKFNNSCCPSVVNMENFVEFSNIDTTPYTIILPFTTAREIHLQGVANSNLTQIIIEYTTTNNSVVQKHMSFLAGTVEIQLPVEKKYFTSLKIYTNSGTIIKGHINFIN